MFGRRFGNLLLVTLSLFVAFCVLELGVRIAAWNLGRGFWEHPHSFVSPFFTTDGPPWPLRDGDHWMFREGEKFSTVKPAGQVRVVCLGGSTTLPALDAEGVSYPRELERLLRARFPGADVVVGSAGENGFSSAHSLVNLALRVTAVEPDVVTVYHNINDLSANYFGDGVEPDYRNKYGTEYFLAYRHRGGFLAQLGRMSRLMRVIHTRIGTVRRGTEGYDEAKDWRPGVPLFRRNLRSIVAVARAQGMGVVLGTQAARTSRREGDPGFRAYGEVVREVAAETGTPLADAMVELKDDALFTDDVHLMSDGARAVARVLLEPVAALLAERRGRDLSGVR